MQVVGRGLDLVEEVMEVVDVVVEIEVEDVVGCD